MRQNRERDPRFDALFDCGGKHLLQEAYIPLKSKKGKGLLQPVIKTTITCGWFSSIRAVVAAPTLAVAHTKIIVL